MDAGVPLTAAKKSPPNLGFEMEESSVDTDIPGERDMERIPPHTTVYPAKAWVFPAVSFRTVEDALEHIHVDLRGAPCGICSCPAGSFDRHFPGTL